MEIAINLNDLQKRAIENAVKTLMETGDNGAKLWADSLASAFGYTPEGWYLPEGGRATEDQWLPISLRNLAHA